MYEYPHLKAFGLPPAGIFNALSRELELFTGYEPGAPIYAQNREEGVVLTLPDRSKLVVRQKDGLLGATIRFKWLDLYFSSSKAIAAFENNSERNISKDGQSKLITRYLSKIAVDKDHATWSILWERIRLNSSSVLVRFSGKKRKGNEERVCTRLSKNPGGKFSLPDRLLDLEKLLTDESALSYLARIPISEHQGTSFITEGAEELLDQLWLDLWALKKAYEACLPNITRIIDAVTIGPHNWQTAEALAYAKLKDGN